MRSTDGNGERIHAGAGHEFLDLVRLGVGGVCGIHMDIVLDAGELAQLTLHHDAMRVGILHDLAGQRDVVLKGMLGAVDHNGGEPAVDARLADVEIRAVVQMQGQVNAAVGNGCLCQRHEVRRFGVLPRACGDLQDDGGLNLTCCLGNRLHDLHVVDVEGADGVTARIRLFEHRGSCDKSHICFSIPAPAFIRGAHLRAPLKTHHTANWRNFSATRSQNSLRIGNYARELCSD